MELNDYAGAPHLAALNAFSQKTSTRKVPSKTMALSGFIVFILLLLGSITTTAQDTFVYLSAFDAQKIVIYRLDRTNKQLVECGYQATYGSPFALTTNSKKDVLYASILDKKQVASFYINRNTGMLSPLNSIDVVDGACHLRVSNNDKFLLSAYFGANKIAIYPVDSDSKLNGNASQILTVTKWPHMSQLSPSGKLAFVPNMGGDLINQYTFNDQTGKVSSLVPDKIATPSSTGPRHMVFHPHLPVVYFSMELSSQTIACHFTDQGLTAPFQTIDNLPEGYTSTKWTSDIHITPNGKFIYTANRVHTNDTDKGSITAFSVNNDGELALIDRYETEKTVREFDIDPSGQFLIAAGEKSGKTVLYEIMDNGSLTKVQQIETDSGIWWVSCLSFDETNTTGMSKIGKQETMKLYPNPNKGSFIIELGKRNEALTGEVVNSMGHPIHYFSIEKSTPKTRVCVPNSPAGIYQVILYGNKTYFANTILLL